MKIARIATTSVKGQPWASRGLSSWKTIARLLLFGVLVAAAFSGDAGILTTGDSTKQTTATGAVPPNQTKNQHQYTNRLIHEKSPYLLLHAHNPVDWYPWGEEAFAKAKRENKPIFLSVGYYTCHWCHVMERESYSNPAIAELLNRWFVSIKVDREERPDIDNEYMSFVQATTGSGGWPMNVFLTPDLKPFFGGTYFPPEDKYGATGLHTLLP
ncbi:MAG TPA: thioredoxin domain-containing protein, partial [Terriglobales bacterium]|nr:thioredoxin domain-containing protein [Terriglobales bacterium]